MGVVSGNPIVVGPIGNPSPITVTQGGTTVDLQLGQQLTLATTGGNTVSGPDQNQIDVSGNGQNGPVDVLDVSGGQITQESNSNISLVGNDNSISTGSSDQTAVFGSANTIALGTNSTFTLTGASQTNTINAASGDIINIGAYGGPYMVGPNTINAVSGDIVNIAASVGAGGYQAADVINISNGTINVGTNAHVTIVGNNNTIIGDSSDTISVTGTGNTISGGTVVTPPPGNPAPITVTQGGTTVNLQLGQQLTLATTGGNTVNGPGQNPIDVSGNGQNGLVDVLDVSGGQITQESNSNISVAGSNNSISTGSSDQIAVFGAGNTIALGANTTFTLTGASQGNTINATSGDIINIAAYSGPSVVGLNTINAVSGDVVNVAANVGAGGYQAPDVINISNGTINVGANAHVTIVGHNDTIIASSSASVSVTGYGNTITAGTNSTVTIVVNGTGVNAGTGDTVSCGPGSTINVTGNGQNGAVTTINNATNVTINQAANTDTSINGSNFTVDGGSYDTISATANGAATINDTGSGTNVTANETQTVSTPEIIVDLSNGTVNTSTGGINASGNGLTLRQILLAALAAEAQSDPDSIEGNNDAANLDNYGNIAIIGNLDQLIAGQKTKSTITGIGNSGSFGDGSTVQVGGNGENGQADQINATNSTIDQTNNSNVAVSGIENSIQAGQSDNTAVNGFGNDLSQQSGSTATLTNDNNGQYTGLGDTVSFGSNETGLQVNDPHGQVNFGANDSGTVTSSNTTTNGQGSDTLKFNGDYDTFNGNNSNITFQPGAGLTNVGDTVTGSGDTVTGAAGSGSGSGGGGFNPQPTGGVYGPWTWGSADDRFSYSGNWGYGGTGGEPFSYLDLTEQHWNGTLTETVDSAASGSAGFQTLKSVLNYIMNTYNAAGSQWSSNWTLQGGTISQTFSSDNLVYTEYTFDIDGYILTAFTNNNSVPAVYNYAGTGPFSSVAITLNNYQPSSPGGGGGGSGGSNGGGSTITGHVLSNGGSLSNVLPAYSVAQFETEQATLDLISGGFLISDAPENVASAIDALNADTNVAGIVLSNSDPLALTVAQTFNDTAALGKIAASYQIVISDTAAAVLSNRSALAADPQVMLVTVSDTAANVAANIDALNADSQISLMNLTDGSTAMLALSVAQFIGDAAVLGLIGGSYQIAIHDTAANVLANLDALGANPHLASISLTDAGTPVLTVSLAQAVKDAAALAAITSAHVVNVSGTAANIDALTTAQIGALGAAHVNSLTATDAGLSLTPAQVLAFGSAGITLLVPQGATVPAPALSVTSINSSTAGQAINLSSLVTIADPGHAGYQKLELWDSDGTPAGGEFLINGLAQTGGHVIDVPTGANVVFDAPASSGTDTLWAQLIQDNGTGSGWQQFTVTVPKPILSVSRINSAWSAQMITLSSLVTIADPGNVGYQKLELWEGAGGAGGKLVVNGAPQSTGQEIDVIPANFANTIFDAGTGFGTDTLWAQLVLNDGNLSGWERFTVSVSAPTLVVGSVAGAPKGQAINLPSLVSISDPSSVGYQKLELWDGAGGDGGKFVVNGAVQAVGQEIDVNPADLANTVFDAGTALGTDTLWAQLVQNDGTLSGWQKFSVSVTAPTLGVTSFAGATKNQQISLSTLVSILDPSSVGYQKLELWDSIGGAGGKFVINGTPQSVGQEIDVSAASFANTVFDAGTVAGTDTLWAQLVQNDGTMSGWEKFSVSVPAPTLFVSSVAGVARSEMINLSSLAAVSDPSNIGYQKLELWDSLGGSGGQFVVNGVPQTAGQEIDLTPAQAAATTFQVGAAGGTDTLWAQLVQNDGTLSGWQQFTVNAPLDNAPVVSGSDTGLTLNTSVAVSALFSTTDPDGDVIKTYQFWDSNDAASSGHFLLSGAIEPAGQAITIDASQYGAMSFQAASSPQVDRIWERASDGTLWSNWAAINLTSHA